MNRRKQAIALCIVGLTLFFLVATIPNGKAQFVIAEWDFPDEYGQGIRSIATYENSTGSWEVAYGIVYYDESPIVLDWNTSVGIKLRVWTHFNATLTGASSLSDGKNYQRHNVTVYDQVDTLVFEQSNFTYYTSSDEGGGIYHYFYDVVLDFLPQANNYYTVTVTYEIWW